MKKLSVLFIFFSMILFSPSPAHAYIDPGTGSYLLQLIMAAIVGCMVAVKQFWQHIKIFFKNIFSKKKN